MSTIQFGDVIASLLSLLDVSRCNDETKSHQIIGLKLLRKIVEVVNPEEVTPAADWDNEEWEAVEAQVEVTQNLLVSHGCAKFLCRHLSDCSYLDVNNESILVSIALLLGGNGNAQEEFLQYMIEEDESNKLLIQIKDMLVTSFAGLKDIIISQNIRLESVAR